MADEKKIIIDEDWKAQVQAEKEAAAKSRSADSPKGADAAGPVRIGRCANAAGLARAAADDARYRSARRIGRSAASGNWQSPRHPNQAKYLIDTIDVLRQKTKGNLSPAEQQTDR